MKKILSRQAAFFVVLLLAVAVGFVPARISEAAANIQFDATGVEMPGGMTVIYGVFTNFGDTGATITDMEISVQITDEAGNYIWSDSCEFSNVNAFVPAGGQHTHTFTIRNSNCPSYYGRIRWSVDTHTHSVW